MNRRTPDLLSRPMEEQYQALVRAFDYFNRKLFNGILPGCILSFSSNHKTNGFMIPERWRRTGEDDTTIHEICLSIALLQKKPIDLFGSLVHEMVHLWQWEYGSPSRRNYHNTEWARKMESIGLTPSDTGEPNGKMTGQSVEQYVLEGGLYQQAFEQMPKQYILPFTSDANFASIKGEKAKLIAPPNRRKTKYSCPGCGANAWGKPDLAIICGICHQSFQAI